VWIVSDDCSVSNKNRVDGATEFVYISACLFTGDPSTRPVSCRDSPIKGRRDFPSDVRTLMRHRERPHLIEFESLLRKDTFNDSDTRFAQTLSTSRGDRIRISLGKNHARDTCGDEGLGTRPSTSGVCAGFKGDYGGGTNSRLICVSQCADLGVR
jgi:hypothetical protein